MAIVVAILEFCWNSKRNAQQEKVFISFYFIIIIFLSFFDYF